MCMCNQRVRTCQWPFVNLSQAVTLHWISVDYRKPASTPLPFLGSFLSSSRIILEKPHNSDPLPQQLRAAPRTEPVIRRLQDLLAVTSRRLPKGTNMRIFENRFIWTSQFQITCFTTHRGKNPLCLIINAMHFLIFKEFINFIMKTLWNSIFYFGAQVLLINDSYLD